MSGPVPLIPALPPAGGSGIIYLPGIGPVPNIPPAPSVDTDGMDRPRRGRLNQTASSAQDRQETIAGENSLLPIVYGGPELLGPRIPTVLEHNGNLVLLCVLADGPVQEIGTVRLGDAALPPGVAVNQKYTGVAGQGIDPTLAAAFAAKGLAYTDALPGVAYMVVTVAPGASLGFPRLTAEVKGLKVARCSGFLIFDSALAVSGGDQYRYHTISTAGYTIQSGDKLTYDVWVVPGDPAGGALVGGLDLRFTDATNLRASTCNDQNGQPMSQYTPGSVGGVGAWVTRTASLPAGVVGKTTNACKLVNEANTAGQYRALYRNVRITNSTGTITRVTFYGTGGATGADTVAETSSAGNTSAIVTDTPVWSDNPAECLADLLTSAAYGCGLLVSWESVAHAAMECDRLVGVAPATEKKRLLALTLDSSRDPWEWVETLSAYAGCFVVPDGPLLRLVPDAPAASVATFDTTNIVEGTFTLRERPASAAPNVVRCVYTDTSGSAGGPTRWRDAEAIEYGPGVLAGTVDRREQRFAMPGIKRYSQAYRESVERLNHFTLEDVTCEFTAVDDGLKVLPASVITVTHPVGPSAKLFRVRKITDQGFGRYRIAATEYDPLSYSSLVQSTPSYPNTGLGNPNDPPAIASVSLVEQTYRDQAGLTKSRLYASWAHAAFGFVLYYTVDVYEGAVAPANKVLSAIAYAPEFFVGALKEQATYYVVVALRSTSGATGASATASAPFRGKYLPPSPVPSLNGFEAGGRVYLTWGAASDLSIDVLRYELRVGPTTGSPETATFIDRVSSLTYLTQGFPAGTLRFYVAALDSVGNYSETWTHTDIEISVDDGAFRALLFKPSAWSLFAATQWRAGGVDYATTDWGDTLSYGTTTKSDATGTMNDGSVGQTVPMTQPHSRALHFPAATTAYVNLPHAAGLNVGTTFSLDAWVFPVFDGDAGSTPRTVYSHGIVTGGVTEGGWALMCKADGTLYVNDVTATIQAQSASGLVQNRRWHHVCLTVAGTGATDWKLYLDGVLVATSSTGYTAKDNANAKRIGGTAQGGGSYPWRGLLSRVRLWDAALSAAEVLRARQYRGTDVTTVIGSGGLTAANLKSSWLLDDAGQNAAATTAADQKSVSTGALNGALEWRSWDEVSGVVDLGQVFSGTFVLSPTPTAIEGAVRVTLQVSEDGIAYNDNGPGASVAGRARFIRVVMQAEGGSARYDLTNTAVMVNLVPREEMGQATTIATTGVPKIIVLAGRYSQASSILLQPRAAFSGSTPLRRIPLYDQVEVSGGRGLLQGRALRFPGGSSSYVTVGDHAQFTFGNGTTDSAFTAECLVKFDAIGTVQTFFGKGTGTPAGEWQIRVQANGRIALLLVDQSAGALITIYTQTAFAPGIWYHVAATYSGSNPLTGGVKLYVNGKEEPQGVTTVGTYVAMENTAEPLILGNQYNAGLYNTGIAGVMDEVRIWNVVRTQQQIADNMAAYVAANASGLVGYWKLDETTGTTAVDSQTNTTQRNGALSSAFGANTEKWWRPYDGFDLYCLDGDGTQVAAEVQWFWKGA